MTKKLYLLLFLIASISQLISTEWTILIYMAADNGLHNYALDDIEEMELSQFGEEANIIVQMDGDQDSDLPNTYRYKIKHYPQAGIQSNIIQNLGETNSGSYLTLQSFVEWGFKRYKSEKKALIVWSHANGWAKDIKGKGIAPDNDSESFISLSEHQMQAALAKSPLDLLIYDACNMQSIENLVELKGRADYIIGSEETVPVTGLPYSQVFDYWLQAENTDSLAVNIPKIYVEAYRPGNIYNSGPYLKRITSSAVKMTDFAIYEDLLNNYLAKWSQQAELFITARENITEFGLTSTDVDIKELLQYLSLNSPNQELANDSDLLYQQLLETFISHDSSSFDYKVGLASIWFPRYSYQFVNNWPIYRNLNFSQGKIGNFLNKYLAPDEIPPFPFAITKAMVLNETLFLEWENNHDPDPLTYYLNFSYADGTPDDIILQDVNIYQTSIKQAGKLTIVAEDASENRRSSETIEFVLGANFGEIYLAPNPLKNTKIGNLIIYDTNIGGKEARISVYSISGKKISTRRIVLADDQNEHKLSLAEILPEKLSQGIYLCLVEIGNKAYKTKFSLEY